MPVMMPSPLIIPERIAFSLDAVGTVAFVRGHLAASQSKIRARVKHPTSRAGAPPSSPAAHIHRGREAEKVGREQGIRGRQGTASRARWPASTMRRPVSRTTLSRTAGVSPRVLSRRWACARTQAIRGARRCSYAGSASSTGRLLRRLCKHECVLDSQGDTLAH